MGSNERMISKMFINLEEDFLREIVAKIIDNIGKRIIPNKSGGVGELEGFSILEFKYRVRKDKTIKIKL